MTLDETSLTQANNSIAISGQRGKEGHVRTVLPRFGEVDRLGPFVGKRKPVLVHVSSRRDRGCGKLGEFITNRYNGCKPLTISLTFNRLLTETLTSRMCRDGLVPATPPKACCEEEVTGATMCSGSNSPSLSYSSVRRRSGIQWALGTYIYLSISMHTKVNRALIY